MLNESSAITENVPTMAIGSVRLGIMVATTFRRNRKITITTSPSASRSENFTSLTDRWMDADRSNWRCTLKFPGNPFSISASSALILVAIATVFVPGWRVMNRLIVRSPL